MDNFDLIADGGPGPDWYRELAESHGAPWPHAHAMTRDQHRALTAPPPTGGRGPEWVCPRCGGPAILPALAATLPYRRCGYAEARAGAWVHE